jgi:hypothetical protein
MSRGRSAYWAGLERPIAWCEARVCGNRGARYSKKDGLTLCKSCRDAQRKNKCRALWVLKEYPLNPDGSPLDAEGRAFFDRYGYTQFEAAEMSYVGKLLDAAESDEERDAITDFFAG